MKGESKSGSVTSNVTYVTICNQGNALNAAVERVYFLDLPRSPWFVVVGRACWAVHIVG